MTTFMPPPPAATFLAFHPQDNNIIAIGMDDSSIQIYNVRVDEVPLSPIRPLTLGVCFALKLVAKGTPLGCRLRASLKATLRESLVLRSLMY